jgi:hypothetical protein
MLLTEAFVRHFSPQLSLLCSLFSFVLAKSPFIYIYLLTFVPAVVGVDKLTNQIMYIRNLSGRGQFHFWTNHLPDKGLDRLFSVLEDEAR